MRQNHCLPQIAVANSSQCLFYFEYVLKLLINLKLGRRRPIIVRFVCRKDRDKVWSVRDKVKESMTHADAYITQDYARAIREERKVLIKAMIKAREEHGLNDAKMKGRFLFINNERYDSKSIPEYLKQP